MSKLKTRLAALEIARGTERDAEIRMDAAEFDRRMEGLAEAVRRSPDFAEIEPTSENLACIRSLFSTLETGKVSA